jgi:replication-associated recombination protein RarA
MADLFTKNGHNMFDVSSLLQKAIRRGHHRYAGYAANELLGRYRSYLWKRLLTISAEDCWGVVTAEIVGLKKADDFVNATCKGYDINPLFVAKAVTLLIKARKNRDADYFACNLLNSNETIGKDEYLQFVNAEEPRIELPEYTYDCHTQTGKAKGKTKLDMIKSEQEALNPCVVGDYDNMDWSNFFKFEKEGFDKEKGFPLPTKQQLAELESGEQRLFD